ncbi:MAG: hypothetical protein H6R21_1087 [Proteobacteria bacterium]|nr:hypothetical protein [Pseudomonadota bacterium]
MIRAMGLCSILIFLSGCAAEITAATPRAVIVKAGLPDRGIEKALALADAECSKHGRRARPVDPMPPGSGRYVFDCIFEFSNGAMR